MRVGVGKMRLNVGKKWKTVGKKNTNMTFSDNGLIVQMPEVPKKKDEDTLRPKTRSASRKESWNKPKVSMGSDNENSDEDVEMLTKRGRRAGGSPSDTA